MGIKSVVKKIFDYTIENDMRVLTLKHTKIKVRFSLTKRAFKKYGHLPIVPNRIVFDNYMGKGYGCNSKYVTEALLASDAAKNLDIVWLVRDASTKEADFPAGVRVVEYGSPESLEMYYTAAIWVSNYHLAHYFNKGLEKRPGQTYIQMWHGSLGIKRLERDTTVLDSMPGWKYLIEKNSRMTDYWISNSDFESDVFKSAFWDVTDDKIKLLGHARNDVFFDDKYSFLPAKVRGYYSLDSDTKIALYVPTYREDNVFPDVKINVEETLSSLSSRFGGTWKFMARLHPRMKGEIDQVLDIDSNVASDSVIIANDYPDIQELLAASDALITDYSSCIFDFMLSIKPAFFFVPDIDKYNSTRGFYYSMEETPFSIARDMTSFKKNIASFDDSSYASSVQSFLQNKGCIDDGKSAGKIADFIQSLVF